MSGRGISRPTPLPRSALECSLTWLSSITSRLSYHPRSHSQSYFFSLLSFLFFSFHFILFHLISFYSPSSPFLSSPLLSSPLLSSPLVSSPRSHMRRALAGESSGVFWTEDTIPLTACVCVSLALLRVLLRHSIEMVRDPWSEGNLGMSYPQSMGATDTSSTLSGVSSVSGGVKRDRHSESMQVCGIANIVCNRSE